MVEISLNKIDIEPNEKLFREKKLISQWKSFSELTLVDILEVLLLEKRE